MREVKFRIWDKDSEIMKYQDDNLISFGDRYCSLEDVFYFQKKDFEIMQYINLKDTEGNEIYEDDIISDGTRSGVVYFDEDRLQYRVKFSEGFTSEITFSQSGSRINKTSYKIVGNIHGLKVSK